MERVHQDDIGLWKNRRLYRHYQGPPFGHPGIDEGDLAVEGKLLGNTLSVLVNRGPPQDKVSIKHLGVRLCIPKDHQHSQSGFAREVHEWSAGRRVAAAQLRCSSTVERDVFRTRKPPYLHRLKSSRPLTRSSTVASGLLSVSRPFADNGMWWLAAIPVKGVMRRRAALYAPTVTNDRLWASRAACSSGLDVDSILNVTRSRQGPCHHPRRRPKVRLGSLSVRSRNAVPFK